MDSWLKYLRNTIHYLRNTIHSSFCSIITAPKSLNAESSLGKIPTSVRCLISLFSLSRGLVERICLWCSFGRSSLKCAVKTVLGRWSIRTQMLSRGSRRVFPNSSSLVKLAHSLGLRPYRSKMSIVLQLGLAASCVHGQDVFP